VQRLIRDIIVAVVGGIIVGLVVTFTTSLNRIQLALVYAGSLIACGLVLGFLELPRLIRQRRETFKNEVIAAARSAIMNDLAVQTVAAQNPGQENILHPGPAYTKLNERERLVSLLQDGYKARARLREFSENRELEGPLAVEIDNWQGMVLTALVNKPKYQQDFRNAGGAWDFMGTNEAYGRVGSQIRVLEEVIQSMKTKN
jgi:hypothetical protein